MKCQTIQKEKKTRKKEKNLLNTTEIYDEKTINKNQENEDVILIAKETEKDNKKKFLEHPLISGLIILVIGGIGGLLVGMIAIPFELDNIKFQLNNINDDIKEMKEDMKEDIGDLDEELKEVSSKVSKFDGMYIDERLKNLEDILKNQTFVKVEPTEEIISSLKMTHDVTSDFYYLSAPTWSNTDIIATDSESGEKYSATELIEQKLFIPYKSEGQDILFLGQFNEKNHWNGNCLFNVYENDVLVFIMEAEYNDGNLKSYKQVIPAKTARKENIWIISERENIGKENIGNSWNYIKLAEYEKIIDSSIKASEVISVDMFKRQLNTRLEGYYHGKTSNGSYNDNTGTAYLIKYADDGTIRTLYCGNFKNGMFHDNTGNAWYITKEPETSYMYYKGIFENGYARKDKNSYFENDLTIERINEITENKEFDCELNWLIEEIL